MMFEHQLTSRSSHLPLASRKPPEPILHLRKSLIRSLYEGDKEALAREANNPGIARWMRNTFPHPYGIDDAARWISIASSASPLRDFAICRLDTNTVIGCIGLKTQDDIHHRTMEIGYWLGEDHWNQGIASKAISVFS